MSWGARKRHHPYTAAGIRRVACVRCAQPAVHQWQVCADDRAFRTLCGACDIALNDLVLRWAGHPSPDAAMARYRERIARNA
jgi:hypothetical protein